MLARHLTLANIPFKVFERDESPETRQVSGTLDVHPLTGQLALKEAGLLDQFNAIARHGVRTRFVDAQAKTIVDFDDEPGTDEERPEIDRMDLQRILQGSVSLDTVNWGCKIQAVKRNPDGDIAIHMANGEVESGFRLVVGADGAWSKVRNLFTSTRPKYSGTTLFSTIIHPQDAMYSSVASLVHQGNYMGLQNGQAIYMFYLGDGTYHVSAGTQLAERRAWDEALLSNPEELWKILKSDFEGWTSELTDPIRKSERGFRPWPLYNMPMEGVSWEPVSGATLVGDAAHLT
jgi:2-polyprenyl-6-methoxyphenol hydroxylase-like FAD-dependent oxidoreductase